jgi:alkanesulfonate monooxygenase SsuD/methylene tetrahydromethanopterin reductase-like flavin-dependent oxidoreductase (luciferase family)
MITRFGSLYAGHVDLDGHGFDAMPVNDRWLPDEHLASVFDKATAIAKLMDRLNYDVLWLAEHHFQREGYECIPNILMLAVHLAHLTERLKFGCGFNIVPMWHPLRLAEDYATADILTGGRVLFGIGRGYHTREVETFGAPMLDPDANRELFEEQVDIIFKAFNERSFAHSGKHYELPPRVAYRGYELQDLTLVPRPVRRPVDCWQPIVSASQRGLDFMAKHGIKGVIGGGAALGGAASKTVIAWQEALARQGRQTELGGDLVIGVTFHIADSEEQGIREAKPFFEEWMKMFAPLGFVRGLSDEQVRALADPALIHHTPLPTIEEAIRSGAWIVGPPERLVERLQEMQSLYPGLEEVHVGQVVGTDERVILEQLEWFARDVMPVFKMAKTAKTATPAPAVQESAPAATR